MAGIIIGVVVVLLGFTLFASFSRLAKARNRVDATWQCTTATFDKRRELIPPLIELLRTANDQEASYFKSTMQTRREAAADTALNAVRTHESDVSHEMKNLLRGIAAYPGLKSDQTFYDLCSRLQESEDQIDEARMEYNDAVKAYNAVRAKFPMRMLTGLLDFEPENYFDLEFVIARKSPEQKGR